MRHPLLSLWKQNKSINLNLVQFPESEIKQARMNVLANVYLVNHAQKISTNSISMILQAYLFPENRAIATHYIQGSPISMFVYILESFIFN